MKVLLDTNRLSDALAEVDEVLDHLEAAEAIYVPAIALGEIRSGFLEGRRAAQNETRLTWFLSQDGVSTVSVDPLVTHRYAAIHRALRHQGTPIPDSDLWIAVIAVQHALVVHTPEKHFAHVGGLACL